MTEHIRQRLGIFKLKKIIEEFRTLCKIEDYGELQLSTS